MRLFTVALAAVVVAGCSPVADPTAPLPTAAPPAPTSPVIAPEVTADSTAISPTVLPADKRIADEIRQKIHTEEKLSANARSVEIIVAGGKVSLRGTVDSSEEKDTVEKLAADVVGKDNLTSDVVWKDK